MSKQPIFIELKIGSKVFYKDNTYIVTHHLDIYNILGKEIPSGKVLCLPISQLSLGTSDSNETKNVGIHAPLSSLADEVWDEANKRYQIIEPLLHMNNRTRADVAARAQIYGKDVTSLYRWIATYESTGQVQTLVRKKRSDKGNGRIEPVIEEIIKSAIDNIYLNKQRYSVKNVSDYVISRCRNAGIKPPHPNTIKNRISNISNELVTSRRFSKKRASSNFDPIKGPFPGADFPLSVVQIDHTKLDIVLVDDLHRRPIGRPWLTLAFDVYSRVVCGFYISFDPPGVLSTSMCLAHSILPKEKWLTKRDLTSSWPVWGTPDNLHLDNAKEFRGNALRRACEQYGITINWRPVARPHYGGHVERMMGTLSKAIHELPGTTFSNPKERAEYDSEGKAVLTLSEFEKWLAIYIMDVYHQRIHSEIGTSPLKKLEEGLLGHADKPGRGLPTRAIDEQRLLLDFMPYEERTVQEYGVIIDNIHYYSDVLRRWINAPDVNNPKQKRKFIFKLDPRDISYIYFFDPELNLYYPVPYRDTSRPPMSIWEAREAIRYTRERVKGEIKEDLIFEAYEKLRQIEKESLIKSKKARRALQRRVNGKAVKISNTKTPPFLLANIDFTETNEPVPITPFDDIDEG